MLSLFVVKIFILIYQYTLFPVIKYINSDAKKYDIKYGPPACVKQLHLRSVYSSLSIIMSLSNYILIDRQSHVVIDAICLRPIQHWIYADSDYMFHINAE